MSKHSLDAVLRKKFPPVPTAGEITIPTPFQVVRPQARHTGPTAQMHAVDIDALRREMLYVPDCIIDYRLARTPDFAIVRGIIDAYFKENNYRTAGQDMQSGAKIWRGPENHEVQSTVKLCDGAIIGYVRTRRWAASFLNSQSFQHLPAAVV